MRGMLYRELTPAENMGLRETLAEEYRYIPDQELYEMVSERLKDMTPEQAEDFWNSIKNIGSTIVARAPSILQGAMQGGTTGAAFGPWGALGGAALGALGGGLSGAKPPQQPPQPPPQPQMPQIPMGGGGVVQPPGQTPAAAQLMQLLNSPLLQQALSSLVMGNAGRQSIPVGRTQVPIGDLLGVVSNLAGSASKEAAEAYAEHPGEAYFQGSNDKYDQAVPEQRAEALKEWLWKQPEFFNVEDFHEEDPLSSLSEGGRIMLYLK